MGGYRQILPLADARILGTTLLLGQQAVTWQQQSRRRVRRWLQVRRYGLALLFALLHVTTGTLQKPSQYL